MNARSAALLLALLVTVPGVASAQVPEPPALPVPPVAVPELPVPVPSLPPAPALPPVPAPAPPPPPALAPTLPSVPGVQSPSGSGGAAPAAPAPSSAVASTPSSPRGSGGTAGSTGSAGSTASGGGVSGSASASDPGEAQRGTRPASPAKRRAAKIRRRDQRLLAAVQRYRGCLPHLTRLQRRVLKLRAGVGDGPPRSRARVAQILDRRPSRVAKAERRGLRSLRRAARAGRCVDGHGRDPLTEAREDPIVRLGDSMLAEVGGGTLGEFDLSEGRSGRDEDRSGVKGSNEEALPPVAAVPGGGMGLPPIWPLVLVAAGAGAYYLIRRRRLEDW